MSAAAIIQKRYREKRKRLGLCSKCKHTAVPGRTLCEKHLFLALVSWALVAKWKKENNYCRQGGCWETTDGGSRCIRHKKLLAQSERQKRRVKKYAGICTWSGCWNKVKTLAYCSEHSRH